MEITIVLSGKELRFIEKIIREMKTLGKGEISHGDAVHQCITMAMYEEAEEGS